MVKAISAGAVSAKSRFRMIGRILQFLILELAKG